MTYRKISTLAALALMLAAAPATAQDEMADAPVNTGAISLGAGIDVTDKYFFRGIFQENQGIIVQPWAELGVNLYEGEGTVSSVDATFGIWNSLHDGPSGSGGVATQPGIWYEADIYAGLSFSIDKFTAGLTWTAYTSPNNAFGTTQEIALSASYDDSDLWGDKFGGLQPGATIAFEFEGGADGNAMGGDKGVYLELGIEPAFEVVPDTLTISVPVTLGLSIDDYYEDPVSGDDETFGYLDIGVVGTVPLKFMPKQFGTWELSAGVHFLFLGDSNETFNGGDDFEVLGIVGVSMSY